MAFVGVCEARATEIALCESRWSLALPAIALAGQSEATYFMGSGRPGPRGPLGPGPAGGAPLRVLPPRNRFGQFRSTTTDE
jgi:hypothetical protein